MYAIYIGGAILAILLLVRMFNEAHKDVVISQKITLKDLPISFEGTKIFFISDIHKRKISNSIIEKAKGNVDFVIIAGDLAEKGVPISRIDENIKRLASIGPAFFVWGNNDYEADYRDIDASLLKHGVKILDNTAVTFSSDNGEELHLLGLDDLSRKRDNLQLALGDSGEGFKVLVCHDPKISKLIKQEYKIGLLLSAHTHGGQIRIFGWGIAEKGGIKEKDTFVQFISNGYGTSRVPLRLGAPAQTHFIELTCKK